MNILIVTPYLPTKRDSIRGHFIDDQARYFSSLGAEVTVFHVVPFFLYVRLGRLWSYFYKRMPHSRSDYPARPYAIVPIQIPPVPRGFLHRFYKAAIKFSVPFFYVLSSRARSSDIVVSHVALPSGLIGTQVARRLNRPHVLFLHGVTLNRVVAFGAGTRDRIGETILASDAIVTVSNRLARDTMRRFPVDSARVHVIGNAYAPAGEDYDNPVSRTNRNLTFVAVGGLVTEKGFMVLLEAFARLVKQYPNVKVLLFGDGPERKKLEHRAVDLKVSNSIRFLGQRPRNEVIAAMKHAIAMVHPSWREGFGIACLEALAAGTPVIAVEGEGPADFIRPDENGWLVPPKSHSFLLEAMKRVITLPTKQYERMSRSAMATAQTFIPATVFQSQFALLSDVVTGYSNHPAQS